MVVAVGGRGGAHLLRVAAVHVHYLAPLRGRGVAHAEEGEDGLHVRPRCSGVVLVAHEEQLVARPVVQPVVQKLHIHA